MSKKLWFYFGCALVAGGTLAFGSYAYLRWDMFRAQRTANRLLHGQKKQKPAPIDVRTAPHALVALPLRPGEPMGRIEIPRLHLSVMVLEGAAPKILRVAAGHISGTSLPGTGRNIGIAAHRDTFFRPLRDIRRSDEILVTTSYGTYRYVVDATEVVDPSDVQVLRQTGAPRLTLVTCYPFTYIGSAPKRFIVHARQLARTDPATTLLSDRRDR